MLSAIRLGWVRTDCVRCGRRARRGRGRARALDERCARARAGAGGRGADGGRGRRVVCGGRGWGRARALGGLGEDWARTGRGRGGGHGRHGRRGGCAEVVRVVRVVRVCSVTASPAKNYRLANRRHLRDIPLTYCTAPSAAPVASSNTHVSSQLSSDHLYVKSGIANPDTNAYTARVQRA